MSFTNPRYRIGRDFAYPEYRPRYTRRPRYSIEKLELEIEPIFDAREIRGVARYVVHGDRVELDAEEMEILRVDAPYSYDGRPLVVEPSGGVFTVEYVARPRVGAFFVSGRGLSTMVWTQGETEYNHYWVPIPDTPSIKFPWTLRIVVPRGFAAVSNGVLVAVEERGDKLVYVWENRHPMSPYLLAFAAGEFDVWEERCDVGGREVQLLFYVPRGRADVARYSFARTCEILRFFGEYTGVPYPYEKYAQVAVHEFIYGGMENTTVTILTDWTLHDKHAECPYSDWPCTEVDYSSEPLVAHEAAHQWFGDLVTARDWSDIWLNESFATFMEALWTERSRGRDEYMYEIWLNMRTYLSEAGNRYVRPIVTKLYAIPDELFDRHAYEKGSVVLHAIRARIGDGAFREALRRFLERHRYGNADTEDLRKVLEEVTGEPWDEYFDAFIYSAGHPALKVSWSWRDGSIRLSIRQSQGEDAYPVYRLRLPIVVGYGDGRREVREVEVSEREQVIYIPSGERPRYICVDPELRVAPRSLELDEGVEAAIAMLEDPDVVCRLEAIDALRRNGSRRAVEALARALRDPFWGVAAEAARALGSIGTEEAVKALIDAYRETRHPRVRRAIVEALGTARRVEAAEFLDKVLHDPAESYYVRAEAARALGRTRWEGAEQSLRIALAYSSHLDVIKRGALEGLAELGTDTALGVVLSHTKPGHPTYVRTTAIQALARFGPRREVLDAVRDAMRDQNVRIRLAAVAAAEQLLDSRLLGDLQRLAETDVDGRVRRVARDAAERIRRAMERGVEYQRLREEVEKLREEQRRLLDRLSRIEKSS